MSLFNAFSRNFDKRIINMEINTIYELSLIWNLAAIFLYKHRVKKRFCGLFYFV
jgi:hypothetical protein